MLYITDANIRIERQRAAERSRAAEVARVQSERPTTDPLAEPRPEPAWHRSLARLHLAPRWAE